MTDTEDQDVGGESEIQDSLESDEGTDEAEESFDDESNEESLEDASEESESESSEEEQSKEDQDNLEEEEEETSEDAPVSKFKDPKTGNFDWQKINKKVGSDEIQKAFNESQKAITRFGQEKSRIEKEYTEYKQQTQHMQETVNQFQVFEKLYDSNPKVQAAINEALGLSQGARQPQEAEEFQLPQGVDPNDPILPVVRQQQQMLAQLNNHYRQQEQQRQREMYQAQFRQGLESAKQAFTTLVGRSPSEVELQKISAKMQQTRYLNGAEWVPSLFVDEIRKGVQKEKTQDHRELKKLKRDLPKTAKKAVSPQKTSKQKLDREAEFYADWDKYMEG